MLFCVSEASSRVNLWCIYFLKWVNQHKCERDPAMEGIGIYWITSLQERNQINSKREDLDNAVFHLHLHVLKERQENKRPPRKGAILKIPTVSECSTIDQVYKFGRSKRQVSLGDAPEPRSDAVVLLGRQLQWAVRWATESPESGFMDCPADGNRHQLWGSTHFIPHGERMRVILRKQLRRTTWTEEKT